MSDPVPLLDPSAVDYNCPEILAIQAEFDLKRPRVAAVIESWFKRSVDCSASIKTHSYPWIEWREGDRSKGQPAWQLVVPVSVLRKIDNLLYEPKCPPAVGDHRVELQRIANKLHDICNRLQRDADKDLLSAPTGGEHDEIIRALRGLAIGYRDLNRCYYLLDPPKSKDSAVERQPMKHYIENWKVRLDWARTQRDSDLIWAIELAMKGQPKAFTNFWIEPLFVLVKDDGVRIRMLNIHTQSGEYFGLNREKPLSRTNRPLQLESEYSKSVTQLREFISKNANGTWTEGERAWQALSLDLDKALAWRDVKEVTSVGWHPGSRSWFSGDCAITEDGIILKPDRGGYYQIGSEKFMMSEYDREGTQFLQKVPRWHPDIKLDRAAVAALWHEISPILYQQVGDFEAWIGMGLTMSYAAAPEIFEQYKFFPGLWIHGEMGSGKSSLVRWYMRFWGFEPLAGVTLGSSSVVGAALVVQQYSNLPVWFDEVQTHTSREMIEMLKAFFDRSGGAKKLSNLREILTSPLVSGQATSNDAATRSRYPHIQMSVRRRLPRPEYDEQGKVWKVTEAAAKEQQRAYLQWLDENMDRFWWFGRFALERRREYVKAHEAAMKSWKSAECVKEITDERARLVYGVVYAGYHAMCSILGLLEGMERKLQELMVFCARAAVSAVEEVKQHNELDQFWAKVDGCQTMGGFGENQAELKRIFKVIKVGELPRPTGVPEESTQRGAWFGNSSPSTVWVVWEIDINWTVMFDMLQKHLRTLGTPLPLRAVDVAAQMKEKPYCVNQADRRTRFGGKASNPVRTWRIKLDSHEAVGYRQCSDDEVAEALSAGEADPRLGSFYRIVQILTGKEPNSV